MRKGILKAAAVCIGLVIALAACGQSGDGKDSGLEQSEGAENSGLRQSENAENPNLEQTENREQGAEGTDAGGNGATGAEGTDGTNAAGSNGTDAAGANVAGEEGTNGTGGAATNEAGEEGTNVAGEAGASGTGAEGAGSGGKDGNPGENPSESKAASGLAQLYEDNFPIGVALPGFVFQEMDAYEEAILSNFNSITCENEMKPDSLLDQDASRANLENDEAGYVHAAVHFDNCMPAITFAMEHDIKIRFHTLVWHSQTPGWFFTEDYTEDGALVDRETMLVRMENYIADVLGYFQENYPGLIYAVDVVNEAFDMGNGDEDGIRMKENLWYETVGADYYYQAFVFARKYASDDMKLFYNDYGCMDKTELILGHLEQAKAEGLIDGIGMQSHLSVDDRIQYKFMFAAKKFCQNGYEVQATELDIGVKEDSEAAFKTQGRKYRSFFKHMRELQEEGYPVTGITVWGLNDALSWRQGEYGLLFDGEMNSKPAYLGAMMDASVPDVE